MPESYWNFWLKIFRTRLLFSFRTTADQRYALTNIGRAYKILTFLTPNPPIHNELNAKLATLKATAPHDVDLTETLVDISRWINDKLGVMVCLSLSLIPLRTTLTFSIATSPRQARLLPGLLRTTCGNERVSQEPRVSPYLLQSDGWPEC